MNAQVFVDFIAEMTLVALDASNTWVMFTDRSSESRKNGVKLMLENKVSLLVEVSLWFKFTTTNKQDEYEAFITNLTLAAKMGAKKILNWVENHRWWYPRSKEKLKPNIHCCNIISNWQEKNWKSSNHMKSCTSPGNIVLGNMYFLSSRTPELQVSATLLYKKL